jgi:hypothetical protein
MKQHACPNCGGADTVPGRKHPWKNEVTPRVCRTCGHEWEPPAPLWFLVPVAALGLLGLALGVVRFALAYNTMPFRVSLFLLGMGLVTGACIYRMIDRRGRTIRTGRPNGPT